MTLIKVELTNCESDPRRLLNRMKQSEVGGEKGKSNRAKETYLDKNHDR